MNKVALGYFKELSKDEGREEFAKKTPCPTL
jgi:hypothetical protein